MSSIVEYILRGRDMLSSVLNNAGRAASNVERQVDRVNSQVERTTNQSRGRIERLTTTLQYLQQRQARAFDEQHIGRYNTAIRNVQRELDRLGNLPPRSFLDRIREGESTTNSLTGKVAQLVATLGILKGVQGIIKMGADLEQSKVGFEVLLGNAEKAKIMLDGLNKYANATPFDTPGLIENAKMMLAFGTSAEKILPRLKMLGDIAMGDQNKMNSLALVMSQVQSLGHMQGNDKIQFINAGFNPLKELSNMTGKSMEYMEDQLSKGKISIEMVESAFEHATGKGGQFYGMMDKISKTTAGKFDALIGGLKQTGAEIGLRLLPYVNRFLEILIPVADWIGNNIDLILQLAAVIGGAVTAFYLITGAIKLWTIAQAILNGVMIMNPIGLIIAGIAALIAIIVIAYNKVSWFRGIIDGLWESFKSLVGFIKDGVMNVVKGLVDTFSGLGKIISSVFDANWDGVAEGFNQATGGFKTAMNGVADVMPISTMIKNGEKLGESFMTGYNNGVAEAEKKKSEQGSSGLDPTSFFSQSGQTTGKVPGAGSYDTSDKLKSITSGGSKPTNITINVNKELVGQITIHPITMSQGTEEVKEIMMQALAQVLNSSNRLAME